jgi:hypothetical protein
VVVERAREAVEGVREAHGVLVAQVLGREPGLDHRHQGAAVARLERELQRGLKARAVGPGLGRGDQDPARALDRLEHVAVVVETVRPRAEPDRPDAADAQVAARVDDPAGSVGPVELALARGVGERVEDPLGRGGDLPLEPELEGHSPSSTNAAKRSSRPSHAAR